MGLGTIRQGQGCSLGKDHLKTEMNKKLGGGGRERKEAEIEREGKKRRKTKKEERERKRYREKHGELRRREPTITQTLKLNFLKSKIHPFIPNAAQEPRGTKCGSRRRESTAVEPTAQLPRIRLPPIFALALWRPEQEDRRLCSAHPSASLQAPSRLAPGIVRGAQDRGWGAVLGRSWERMGGGWRQRKRFCFAVSMSSSLGSEVAGVES